MNDEICLCAVCSNPIQKDATMADHKVYDLDGILEYIELAHINCAVEQNRINDNNYWKM